MSPEGEGQSLARAVGLREEAKETQKQRSEGETRLLTVYVPPNSCVGIIIPGVAKSG